MCMSRPKVPAPTPVIERQPYKNAPSRGSLSADDNGQRRRQLSGVATSAQGILEAASTTKRVKMGGDQLLNPSIGGPGAAAGTILDTAPVSPGAGTVLGLAASPGGKQKGLPVPPSYFGGGMGNRSSRPRTVSV